MLALFSAPDAVVVAAIVAALPGLAAWWNARKAARQSLPNGGRSMRDALNRIETTLSAEVVPRLDRSAVVLAEHADRIASIEADLASFGPRLSQLEERLLK